MSDIKNWSNSAAGNTSTSPNGWPEGMPPSGVNDSAREMMAALRRQMEDADWINWGDTPVRQSATQFLISAVDRTTVYTPNRRLRLNDGVNTFYGYVTSATFASNTTVNVSLDSGALTASLSGVAVGILNPSYVAAPTRMDYLDVSATASIGYVNVNLGGRFNASLDVSGTLSAGFVNVGKTLDVSATASVGALRVGGAFEVSGSSSVAGNFIIGGNLTVIGNIAGGGSFSSSGTAVVNLANDSISPSKINSIFGISYARSAGTDYSASKDLFLISYRISGLSTMAHLSNTGNSATATVVSSPADGNYLMACVKRGNKYRASEGGPSGEWATIAQEIGS